MYKKHSFTDRTSTPRFVQIIELKPSSIVLLKSNTLGYSFHVSYALSKSSAPESSIMVLNCISVRNVQRAVWGSTGPELRTIRVIEARLVEHAANSNISSVK